MPSMDLTPVFARAQGQEENSLEGQCFKEASLRCLNGALSIGATPGWGWGGVGGVCVCVCVCSRSGCPSEPLGVSLCELSKR